MERNVAAESREAFAAWVDESPVGRTFVQIIIRKSEEGYELRHSDDEGVAGLEIHEDPRAAREISRLTESGEHRPLKSAPNLQRGWALRVPDSRSLAVSMNYLYPAAIVHWHLELEGKLGITNYRENAARQSGIYKRVQRLSDEGVQNAARACCDDAVCLKRVRWDIDDGTPLDMERGGGEVPCPEPCSLFVSFARRVRLFEREKRDASGLAPSEREDLTALVEAAAGGGVKLAREAEFEESLNERRMRYRRLTLVPRLRPDG